MNSIRENLHNIIDSYEDEDFLNTVYEILQSKQGIQSGTLWETLSEEQRTRVVKSANDTGNPEKQISHEDMLRRNDKWLKE